MVTLRAHHKHGQVQVVQRHRAAFHAVAAARQGVVQVQVGQVFVVHARGHACGVGVPGHQVVGLVALAQQVFAHAPRPHQVARVQKLEGTRHLFARQVALAAGGVVQPVDLALVDEQAQLAGLGEIGLRGQQREAPQRRQLVLSGHALGPGQCSGGDGQQRAAQAVAHGVYGRIGAVLYAHGLQGIEHAQAQVVVHGEFGIACVRVAPGQHVHRVPLLHQVAHHGVVWRQVEDVVLHDPRRHDEHGLGVHLGGLRCVADQLDQRVAVHHLAGSDGHIVSHAKALRRRVVVGRAGGVGKPVLQALAQVGTAVVPQVLVHQGVGGGPVGGGQHVQPLAGKEVGELGVVRGHAGHLRGFAPEGLGSAKARAPLAVGPLCPGLVPKARVFIGGRGFVARCPAFRQVLASQLQGQCRQLQSAPRREGQVPGPVGSGQPQRHRREPTGQWCCGGLRQAVELLGGCLCRAGSASSAVRCLRGRGCRGGGGLAGHGVSWRGHHPLCAATLTCP